MFVAVDVGGTFTDFVGFHGREIVTTKLPSTRDPSIAVRAGMRELGADGLAHGTTVATNAILERKGARIAFVTTAGFEDLLTIGRQIRPSLYDLRITKPSPIAPRELCVGVRERIDSRGRMIRELSGREIHRVGNLVRRSDAESVAICFLFSFLRPQHERLLAAALKDRYVSTSHEVLAEFREYERASTTALDAYVKPLISRYLTGLGNAFPAGFFVMKSGGGVSTIRGISRKPIETVLSGPAGGVAATTALARITNIRHLVSFDMGGTSADFSAILNGRPQWTTQATIGGFPLAIPVVDIESVGAGGGSIAWIDSGGALRVGPESAGAEPGPMAYAKGGTRPTVTDADMVAGALGPSLLGGRLPLDAALAGRGLEGLAADMGTSVDDAVRGVESVVRANMSKAMRLVLAKRGLDPKDFVLFSFGGAGPMHACALARELGVPRVLVPFLPGAFSAYGILISDVRFDYGRSIVRPLRGASAILRKMVGDFVSQAHDDLAHEGIDARKALLEPSIDLRFRGQSYEINTPMRGDIARSFRKAHRERYGYASRTEPIEAVTVRLTVRVPRRAITPRPPALARPRFTVRPVLFEEGWHETRVFVRSSLPLGFRADGPAIVEEDHATTVVPPGASFAVDARSLLAIEVGP